MDVAFIGLGQMGKAMAANLLRAGHTLHVWNRSRGAALELEPLGARVAAQPAEAAARAEVLMLMLADDAATRAVLIEQGVLEHLPRGTVCVNLSTVSVAAAQEFSRLAAERGIAYVAAPVFGRPEVAASAKLNIVVAGDAAAVARVRPVLAAVGERIWPMGSAPERANVVKLAGNFMIASALETMGEAAALARAHGVPAQQLLEMLTSTLFAAPVYQGYGRLIAEQRYRPAGFSLTLGSKDVRLALQAGEAAHVPMPFGSVLRDRFLEALATCDPDQDWSSIAELSAQHAGVTAPTAAGDAGG
jgi:3-hydroxyisobutyrate dehydrogenase-like beta-hydroxyacid dehydrogenase